MTPNVFDSGIVSSILSWMLCIPLLFGILQWVASFFLKHKGVPRAHSIWLCVCLILLSPARYLLFQVVAAACYAVQSPQAFLTLFLLVLYVPILWCLLTAVGLGLPLVALFPIQGKSGTLAGGRAVAASVVCPLLCLISSLLFNLALPYAGWTVHWLRARDVIRATNGPASVFYRYVVSSFGLYIGDPVPLPKFYSQTPQQPVDLLRCHVAVIYLGDEQKDYFLAHQYPELYKQMTGETPTK